MFIYLVLTQSFAFITSTRGFDLCVKFYIQFPWRINAFLGHETLIFTVCLKYLICVQNMWYAYKYINIWYGNNIIYAVCTRVSYDLWKPIFEANLTTVNWYISFKIRFCDTRVYTVSDRHREYVTRIQIYKYLLHSFPFNHHIWHLFRLRTILPH